MYDYCYYNYVIMIISIITITITIIIIAITLLLLTNWAGAEPRPRCSRWCSEQQITFGAVTRVFLFWARDGSRLLEHFLLCLAFLWYHRLTKIMCLSSNDGLWLLVCLVVPLCVLLRLCLRLLVAFVSYVSLSLLLVLWVCVCVLIIIVFFIVYFEPNRGPDAADDGRHGPGRRLPVDVCK